jgi:hypothetical protein
MITDMHGEEVAITEGNVIDKMTGMASQMTHYLLNRSYIPSAMHVDNPDPTPVKRKIVENYGPAREGRVRQIATAAGLDGEKVRAVWGSIASASGSAAAAAGSASSSAGIALGGYISQQAPSWQENGSHNMGVFARGTVSGAGTVFNVAAGTARTAASGTGAILNFAAQSAQHLLPKPLTAEEYRLLQVHEIQVAKDNAAMGALARLHGNALKVQEERRVSEEAERKRIADEAMAKAQQQELDFQDAYSNAASVVSKTHGVGRRGNLNRNLQSRQPAQEPHVRMEKEEGIGAKLARGGAKLMKGVDRLMMPAHLYASVHP